MSGFEADPEVLGNAARALRAGSDDLEGAEAPAQAPEVGASSGLLASVLSRLAASAGGIVEGLDALANATHASARDYADTDGSAGQRIDALSGRVAR